MNDPGAFHGESKLSERRRKEIASLGHRKYRERLGQLLVEGVRSVEAAVAAGAALVDVVVTAEAAREARVQRLLETAEATAYVVTEAELARLSDVEAAQGVLAVARIPLVPAASLASCTTVLALDGVQDPGNVGTLLRTAAWFGADAVVAGPGTVDLFNPKVVRAAMGGLWDVRLARADDLSAVLADLQQQGFACYGADLAGTPAGVWQPRRPSVLVLGSEGHGLSLSVAARLDARVSIPGAPARRGAESLNVAVAAGILLYEWLG